MRYILVNANKDTVRYALEGSSEDKINTIIDKLNRDPNVAYSRSIADPQKLSLPMIEVKVMSGDPQAIWAHVADPIVNAKEPKKKEDSSKTPKYQLGVAVKDDKREPVILINPESPAKPITAIPLMSTALPRGYDCYDLTGIRWMGNGPKRDADEIRDIAHSLYTDRTTRSIIGEVLKGYTKKPELKGHINQLIEQFKGFDPTSRTDPGTRAYTRDNGKYASGNTTKLLETNGKDTGLYSVEGISSELIEEMINGFNQRPDVDYARWSDERPSYSGPTIEIKVNTGDYKSVWDSVTGPILQKYQSVRGRSEQQFREQQKAEAERKRQATIAQEIYDRVLNLPKNVAVVVPMAMYWGVDRDHNKCWGPKLKHGLAGAIGARYGQEAQAALTEAYKNGQFRWRPRHSSVPFVWKASDDRVFVFTPIIHRYLDVTSTSVRGEDGMNHTVRSGKKSAITPSDVGYYYAFKGVADVAEQVREAIGMEHPAIMLPSDNFGQVYLPQDYTRGSYDPGATPEPTSWNDPLDMEGNLVEREKADPANGFNHAMYVRGAQYQFIDALRGKGLQIKTYNMMDPRDSPAPPQIPRRTSDDVKTIVDQQRSIALKKAPGLSDGAWEDMYNKALAEAMAAVDRLLTINPAVAKEPTIKNSTYIRAFYTALATSVQELGSEPSRFRESSVLPPRLQIKTDFDEEGGKEYDSASEANEAQRRLNEAAELPGGVETPFTDEWAKQYEDDREAYYERMKSNDEAREAMEPYFKMLPQLQSMLYRHDLDITDASRIIMDILIDNDYLMMRRGAQINEFANYMKDPSVFINALARRLSYRDPKISDTSLWDKHELTNRLVREDPRAAEKISKLLFTPNGRKVMGQTAFNSLDYIEFKPYIEAAKEIEAQHPELIQLLGGDMKMLPRLLMAYTLSEDYRREPNDDIFRKYFYGPEGTYDQWDYSVRNGDLDNFAKWAVNNPLPDALKARAAHLKNKKDPRAALVYKLASGKGIFDGDFKSANAKMYKLIKDAIIRAPASPRYMKYNTLINGTPFMQEVAYQARKMNMTAFDREHYLPFRDRIIANEVKKRMEEIVQKTPDITYEAFIKRRDHVTEEVAAAYGIVIPESKAKVLKAYAFGDIPGPIPIPDEDEDKAEESKTEEANTPPVEEAPAPLPSRVKTFAPRRTPRSVAGGKLMLILDHMDMSPKQAVNFVKDCHYDPRLAMSRLADWCAAQGLQEELRAASEAAQRELSSAEAAGAHIITLFDPEFNPNWADNTKGECRTHFTVMGDTSLLRMRQFGADGSDVLMDLHASDKLSEDDLQYQRAIGSFMHIFKGMHSNNRRLNGITATCSNTAGATAGMEASFRTGRKQVRYLSVPLEEALDTVGPNSDLYKYFQKGYYDKATNRSIQFFDKDGTFNPAELFGSVETEGFNKDGTPRYLSTPGASSEAFQKMVGYVAAAVRNSIEDASHGLWFGKAPEHRTEIKKLPAAYAALEKNAHNAMIMDMLALAEAKTGNVLIVAPSCGRRAVPEGGVDTRGPIDLTRTVAPTLDGQAMAGTVKQRSGYGIEEAYDGVQMLIPISRDSTSPGGKERAGSHYYGDQVVMQYNEPEYYKSKPFDPKASMYQRGLTEASADATYSSKKGRRQPMYYEDEDCL